MRSFCYFCILSFKYFHFFVPLYKGLLQVFTASAWKAFSACLMVLDNLCEVLGCSIITDYNNVSMFGFSIAFSWWVVIFDRFTNFLFFFSKYELQFSLALLDLLFFLLNWLQILTNQFFQTFHWIITAFFNNSFVIVFKYKISEFIDCLLFYSPCNI